MRDLGFRAGLLGLSWLHDDRPLDFEQASERERVLDLQGSFENPCWPKMRGAILNLRLQRVITRRGAASIHTLYAIPKRRFCSETAGGRSNHKQDIENVPDHEEMVESNVNQHDIAIVGGGMVGLALACALSSMPLTKQLSVAIVDSNPFLGSRELFKKDVIPDPRVSTVTPATVSFFKEIGAWKYVEQQRHAFFDEMQVWDYTGLGYTRYNARDVGKDCLGCVVENKVLSRSLSLCLQDADFQKTIYSSRVNSMILQAQHSRAYMEQAANRGTSKETATSADVEEQLNHGRLAKLELSDGKSLYAKLVVGADGSKSSVREIAGIKTTGWKYSQSAIICTVEHTMENHCAWQRFLPSGPIALLPIGDNFSNIVWSMSPDESLVRKSMSQEDFVKAVNDALDYGYGPHPKSTSIDLLVDKLSQFTGVGTASMREPFQVPPKVINVVSERLAFPLSLMHAHDYASKRVALIGDAAHTVHPLAGQGVNLGFGDAAALSKVLAEGRSVGSDIGELSLLKKYEKERKAANIAMMAILDGFQKAYSVDLGPVNALRAAAFHGAHYISPLKRNIISYAMGEQKLPIFL